MTKQTVREDRRPFNWLWVIILLLILLLLFLVLWYVFIRERAQEPQYFASSQIVVTGPESQVEEVSQAAAAELGIELVRVIFQEQTVPPPPPFLQPRSDPVGQEPIGELPVPLDKSAESATSLRLLQNNNEVTALYRIVDTRQEPVTVPEVVAEIRQQAVELNRNDVRSDPNYIIGRPVVEIEGDPYCGEAAPVSPQGGSAEDEFYDQWALDDRGIELYTTDANGQKVRDPTLPMGANVRIAMFDTSPFHFERLPVDFASTNVWHFEVAGSPDARDHGVFGASLVNVVAPASEIRIYRVLSESNHGDLVTLLRALDSLLEEWEAEGLNRPHLVINMSLGLHLPPEGERSEENADIFENVETLQRKLQEAASPGDFEGDMGAVIVAASGNDSPELFRQGGAPALAQIPASFDFVIGVGASNINSSKSCFSNMANVYAPGGDNDGDCMTAVELCGNDPSTCMIGYAVHASPDTHYAYWNGTSFAAPLVSGQAALLLERGVLPKDVKQRIIDTSKQISGVQNVEGGIIDLPASMP